MRPRNKADVVAVAMPGYVEWEGTLPSGIPYDPAWDPDVEM